jgi:hypothetical protein
VSDPAIDIGLAILGLVIAIGFGVVNYNLERIAKAIEKLA